MRQRAWPNGVLEQRAYTPRGFLSQIKIVQPGGGTLNQFDYKYGYDDNNPGDYDGTGRIRREVDSMGQTHAFFYNNRYELIGESDPALGSTSLVPPYAVNYTYDLNGNRASRSHGSATDDSVVDAADRLLWINRGTFAEPTSGQAAPYTIVHWDWNDALAKRERRDDSGLLQTLWFWMDGAGRLRKVTPSNDPNASPFFSANYSADGLRTSKDDTQGGVLQHHDFTWTPYGLLWSSNPDTLYSPGYGERAGGIDNFLQLDWLGSTRYVTDSSGAATAAQSYDAWGVRDAQGPGSPNHPSDRQWAGASATRPSGATGRASRGYGWSICSSGTPA